MDVYLDRLKSRSEVLGNHYYKYINFIDTNLDKFMGRLEKEGVIERVHLWVTAHDYKQEMSTIFQVGTTLNEKLTDLGCYFAFQFLQMNLSALDALMLEVTTNPDKHSVYKRFMLRVGHDFRRLTAAYMKHLMALFLPEDYKHQFVFMGVGTRSDQDDIDIGVIDQNLDDRDILNKAIGKMSGEMLKRAICLHFHLSEHVGSVTSYSASIDEYLELLNKEIHDFVIITEMLGGARILGSRSLFFEFRRKVGLRYYNTSSVYRDARFHEGYLRGILGETRSFILRELSRDRISPKGDGLRMIKAGLFAAKTIFNLRQVNAWAILGELKIHDKSRIHFYEQLESSLTFLEIFRYLYQLLVAQEEEIFINDKTSINHLSIVAESMGFKSVGVANATEFLITEYYKNIQIAKETMSQLLPSSESHLQSISVLGKILRHKKATTGKEKRIGNLAIRFLGETRFFRGTRFWDDIINVFEYKDAQILKRLINDLCSLSEEKRMEVLQGYIDWGWNTFIATFSFIILLYKHRKSLRDCDIYKKFNELFFERVRGTEEEAQRLSIVFTHYPRLVYEYTSLLTESQQRKFFSWLDSNVWDPEVLPARDRLRFLLKLQYATSKYFKRVMNNVIDENPEYLHFINNVDRLSLIGKGMLAEVERTKVTKLKFNSLKTFYNFQFFKVGIETLLGTPSQTVALHFSEFADTYLRLLFDTSKQEIDELYSHTLQTKDLLGVFVTGGRGQMLAFDDDFDLIILINSDDPIVHRYCCTIISRMHKELVKSGVLPHYRLAEYTGSYLCTFNELAQLLGDNDPERFIDRAQILGARMVIGSSILQHDFEKQIVKPYILARKKDFVLDILKDMDARHLSLTNCFDGCINLKEDPGGIRDIDMILLICRALFEIFEPSSFKILLRLQIMIHSHSKEFQKLFKSYQKLRYIRDLNRLSLAATDCLGKDNTHYLSDNMSFRIAERDEDVYEEVSRTFKSVLKTNIKIIKEVIMPNIELF